MRLATLTIVSLIPALLWAYFFYRKDRFDKEPPKLVAKAFAAGIIMVIPAAVIEFPFRDVLIGEASALDKALVAFLVVGVGEEFFKYLAVRLTVYNNQDFNEVMDGIVYSIFAALGFASLENLLYTISFGIQVAPIRALLTSVAHASFSGILGFYLGLSRIGPRERRNATIAAGLAIASFLHGLYDYLLVSRLVSPLWAVGMVIGLYYALGNRIRTATEMSPFK